MTNVILSERVNRWTLVPNYFPEISFLELLINASDISVNI